MPTFIGSTMKVKIERLLAEGKIVQEYIGTLSGGSVDQDFYTKNFPITWDAGEIQETGAVVANAPTDTIFKTDLSSAVNDYYNGMTLRFTSGARADEMRVILDYDGASKEITLASALSGAPSVTDTLIVEPSVDVYTDDTTLGSWTEYVEDGTDYIIDGSTGKVTIFAAENQGGNAGERISISYYTTRTITRCQSVECTVEGNTRFIHELGERAAQEIKEGSEEIEGTIGQIYPNRILIGKFLGLRDFYNQLADMSLYLYPNKEVTGQPQFKLSNAKFSGGTLGVDGVNGDFIANVSFKALAIAEGTVPA